MKILVIRLSSFGDVILTTPILTELRAKYPQAEIDFIVLDKFREAIRLNKNIDNLIVFEKDKYKGVKGIYNFSKTLGEYDLIIDLHAKLRSILISKFTKGKVLRYEKRAWWKTLLVKMKLIKYSVDDTIIKNYFKPLKSLGINYKGEKLDFDYSEKDLKKVDEYNDFIVFAPGASKETKKWKKEYFGQLAIKLSEKYKKKIILIGGGNEVEELDYINEVSGGICINLAGKLSLKESGALLSKAEFLLTNDSGPFHMGRGVKTLSFVIFGPTDPNMFEYDKNSILLYANEECSPCSLHGDKVCPKGHFNCMNNLTVDKVFDLIKERVDEKDFQNSEFGKEKTDE